MTTVPSSHTPQMLCIQTQNTTHQHPASQRQQRQSPPTDVELPLATSTEPVMTAPTYALEPKPHRESDEGCESATAVPVVILVELDTGEDWLIDCNREILPPTLNSVYFHHHRWSLPAPSMYPHPVRTVICYLQYRPNCLSHLHYLALPGLQPSLSCPPASLRLPLCYPAVW